MSDFLLGLNKTALEIKTMGKLLQGRAKKLGASPGGLKKVKETFLGYDKAYKNIQTKGTPTQAKSFLTSVRKNSIVSSKLLKERAEPIKTVLSAYSPGPMDTFGSATQRGRTRVVPNRQVSSEGEAVSKAAKQAIKDSQPQQPQREKTASLLYLLQKEAGALSAKKGIRMADALSEAITKGRQPGIGKIEKLRKINLKGALKGPAQSGMPEGMTRGTFNKINKFRGKQRLAPNQQKNWVWSPSKKTMVVPPSTRLPGTQ